MLASRQHLFIQQTTICSDGAICKLADRITYLSLCKGSLSTIYYWQASLQ